MIANQKSPVERPVSSVKIMAGEVSRKAATTSHRERRREAGSSIAARARTTVAHMKLTKVKNSYTSTKISPNASAAASKQFMRRKAVTIMRKMPMSCATKGHADLRSLPQLTMEL